MQVMFKWFMCVGYSGCIIYEVEKRDSIVSGQ